MSTKSRCSKEEIAQRGDEVYQRDIKPKMRTEDDGKFVAVDIITGTYEMDENELNACKRLRERHTDARIWLVRVGSPNLYRFGMNSHQRDDS